MDFTVDRKEFLDAINLVQLAVAKNATIPMLTNILVRSDARNGRVFLTGNDTVTMITGSVKADVRKDGRVAVSASKLLNIAKSSSEDDICINIEDNEGFVHISSGRSRFNLAVEDADNFPLIDNDDLEAEPIVLDSASLDDHIGRVFHASGTDDTRRFLCSVYLHAESGMLNIVATDGHRLAWVQRESNVDRDFKAIVPRDAVSAIRKVCSRGDTAQLIVGERKYKVMVGDFVIVGRLIDGNYPEYQAVVPSVDTLPLEIIVNRDAFITSLKRANIVANEFSHDVALLIDESGLRIEARNSDGESVFESVEAEKNRNDEKRVLFNASFLIDAASACGKEDISINLGEDMTPAMITNADNEGNEYELKMVVMPMRG